VAESERAIILRGGPIFTIDGPIPVAEALAIRGSEILAVGSATEVKRHYTPATEIVDLEGRAVLPGFVEPNLHVLATALAAGGEVPPSAEPVPGEPGEPLAGDTAAQVARDSPERLSELCAETLRRFAARGCTTVYDAGIGLVAGATEHELLGSLARAPDAPVRVRGAFTPELARALGAVPGGSDERYDVVGIAYWADGLLEDFAAALHEPYLNGRGTGSLNHDEAWLREEMQAWHRAGWQLLAHANGDRAIDQVLGVYEALLGEARGRAAAGQAQAPGRAEVPHRIERFALSREDQIAKAAALGLSVSHSIDDIYSRGASLRDDVLGPARAARIHALRSDALRGLCGSCHSDSPRSAVDPCLYLRTAVIRLMRDSDDVLGPAQQLDLAGALRTVTCNPARQVGLGDRIGSLRPGRLADLVVLDRDPRAVDLERLHELRVLETWLGGRRQRWRDVRAGDSED
jgi:predicted amidohydrolase YtcJ